VGRRGDRAAKGSVAGDGAVEWPARNRAAEAGILHRAAEWPAGSLTAEWPAGSLTAEWPAGSLTAEWPAGSLTAESRGAHRRVEEGWVALLTVARHSLHDSVFGVLAEWVAAGRGQCVTFARPRHP
jgi:hypothetical protein